MALRLRLNLPFDEHIMFRGFLPETQNDSLRLRRERYCIALYLGDRTTQLAHVSDVPSDPEELKGWQTLYCRALTMDIEVEEPDRDVVSALEAHRPTDQTEQFGREIFDVVVWAHERVVDYFRNIRKQYWLQPLRLDPRNYQSFLEQCRAVWLDSSGEWRRFLVVREQVQYVTASVPKGGVTRQMWTDIPSFVREEKRAPMRDVLMANSLQHLEEENGRLAVVEAVAALESGVNGLLSGVIRNLPGAPQIEEELLDKLIERAGLRAATEVGLRAIQARAGLDDQEIELVVNAINARNNVLHRQQRAVEIAQARAYVSTIQKVLETLVRLGTYES